MIFQSKKNENDNTIKFEIYFDNLFNCDIKCYASQNCITLAKIKSACAVSSIGFTTLESSCLSNDSCFRNIIETS